MTKVAPWSFSRLKSFEQCPKQFYHEKILKAFPFVQTEAILYGNEFHKAAENFIGKKVNVTIGTFRGCATLDSIREAV